MATFNGTSGNDTLTGGASSDSLYGYAGNDSLVGGASGDVLDGGQGNDTMVGGLGNDIYYIDSTSDVVIENAGEGTDTVYLSATSYNFSTIFVDRIYLSGSAVSVTANSLANYVKGSALANLINALAGADTIYAAAGADTVNGGDDNDIIFGEDGTDILNGDLGDDRLYGGNDADTLNGGDGNDTLSGGVGIDSMVGGLGNDTYYIDNTSDLTVENSNEGIDRVISEVSYTLAANVENITLVSTANINATGNTLDNNIVGNSGNNSLNAGDGNDILNGGVGNDTMTGGVGDDRYYIDAVGDVINENANEGTDSVYTTITHTLSANLERLYLLGDTAINGTGNASNNILVGNDADNSLTGAAGNDVLRGNGGNDTLVGGIGNDTYYVDSDGDIVTESVNEGTDTVYSEVSYVLGSNVENAYLLGTTELTVTGNALNNILRGNTAANTLNGGAGRDIMYGGAGNDTYYVDISSDRTIENASEGTDTVVTDLNNYTLEVNVEYLISNATSARTLTGNSLDNQITGTSFNDSLTGLGGNDTINGGVGTDTMVGGLGDDVYYVNTVADTVTEAVGEGTDTVYSDVTLTLVANVERLILIGSSSINGTGNTLANTITGNNLGNRIDGSTGADTMIGLDGDDVYVVDDAGDVINEVDGQGTDTIESSISFDLLQDFNPLVVGTDTTVEHLTLTGAGAINGLGNNFSNIITGNTGNNTLNGRQGADFLYGNAGNDSIDGGQDNDTIYGDDTANSVSGVDTLNGGLGNDTIYGGQGNDSISGNDGNDSLDGGAGTDTMNGGIGDDTFYMDVNTDVVNENAGEGTDTVITTGTFNYTLTANFENLTMRQTGTATGNASDNIIDANNGVANTLAGGNGNDTYYIDSLDTLSADTAGTDTVFSSATHTLAASFENLTLIGTTSINGTGNASNNVITGNASANRLAGGGGTDTLQGGLGDDVYVFTNAASMQNVTVTEAAGAGNDYVELSTAGLVITTNYNSGTNVTTITVGGSTPTGFSATGVEGVRLGGTGAMTATGGAGADRIVSVNYGKTMNGGDGNDYLDSEGGGGTGDIDQGADGLGGDTMNGGNGSDTYVLSTWDEYNDGGFLNIGDGPETGPTIQDFINDTGTGSGDIDTAIIVWSDYIQDGGGVDDVVDSVSVTIGAGSLIGIENLIFKGTSDNKDADGSAGANMIIGGAGANLLNGLAGNDSLYGGFGNDTLNGGDNNDLLDGGDGSDNMTGGNGDDTYYVDNAGDVVNADASGTDTVYSGVSFSIAGLNIETLILTGTAATATGSTGANLIRGNEAANTINGNGGTDTLEGGAGDDSYTIDSADDVVTENDGQGNDTVTVTNAMSYDISISSRLYIENVTLQQSGTTATGNDSNNTLSARNTAANTLIGGLGDDIYVIDQFDVISGETGGSDVVYLDSTVNTFTYTLAATLETLVIQGADTGINGTGNASNNGLWGRDNANANTLTGLGGDDYYVLGGNDIAVEAASAGTDTAYISDTNYSGSLNNIEQVVAYQFTTNGRNINLATTTTALTITGSTFNDSITGGSANDTLIGGGGNDTLNGGGGDDSYYIDGGETISDTSGTGDTVFSAITYTIAASIENLTLTGTAAVNGTGNTSDNIIIGNSASNVLSGGTGNDTYIISRPTTILEEYTDAGYNGFTPTYAIYNGSSPAGETFAQAFDNNVGTKYLNSSGAGTGVLIDLGVARTVTTLGLTSANDASYRDPKTFTLYGSNTSTTVGMVAITGVGVALAPPSARNTAYANVGFSNTVAYRYYRLVFESIVGGGADTNMQVAEIRLLGDPVGDVIVEAAGAGTDTVQADFSYVAEANIENVILTGNSNINGTGNTLNNSLTGNSANNTLDGGTGTDTMIGGAGDDTFLVDALGETVTENANEGLDTVITTVNYTLGANVENLTGGTGAGLTLTGNTLDNTITSQGAASTMVGGTGNDAYYIDSTDDVVTELASQGVDIIFTSVNYTAAANVENISLLEGSGATTATGNGLDNVLIGNTNTNVLIGGLGDDIYFVDATADTITENASEGNDTVNASATYTLTANLENLILLGSASINGTGNASDNLITGGTGDNSIIGGGGNDTLSGGQGADTLNAGAIGNTTYNFIRNDAVDTIIDSGGSDVLNFANIDISYTQLWFKQTGNDLEIDIIGTNDTVYIKDWYLSTTNRVEVINSGDGYVLSNTDVQQLVQAMSTVTQPVLGETGLAPELYDALELTFFNTWKPI